MSKEQPWWWYPFEAIFKTVVGLGAICAFLIVGCRLQVSQARLNEFELASKRANATVDDRLKELEKEAAERAAAMSTTPLLTVIAGVQQTVPYRDVSEVWGTLSFRNIGLVDASVRQVDIDVHRAFVTDEVQDKIQRTKAIAECREMLRLPTDPDDAEMIRRREGWDERAQQLGRECPHTQLFSVSEESEDVKWEHLKRLSEKWKANLTLPPGQSLTREFVYVLTECLQVHASWLRLDIVVHLETGTSITFSHLIPTRRGPDSVVCRPCFPTAPPSTWQGCEPIQLAPTIRDDGSQK